MNTETGTEYQASGEAWWNQMLMIDMLKTFAAPSIRHRSTLFNIFQQNRTGVETNVEAVCSGL